MSLTFGHPWALLLLVAVAAVAVAIGLTVRPASVRAALGAALPALAATALVLALAAPVVRTGDHRATTVLVDRSASVDGRMRQTEDRWLKRARGHDCPGPCRVVSFAATPVTLAAGGQPPNRNATDLQSGLAAAAALTPPGGRLVVLSDGGQTQGDAAAAAAVAGRRNLSVDWVPLVDPSRRDAAITAIHVPAAVHVGDTVPLTVTVHSTVAAAAVLGISRDGGHPASQSIRLRAGDNPLLLLYTATRRGWNSFSATIALPGDSDRANDAGSAVVHVGAPPRVLVVADHSSRAAALLSRRRLQVTTVAPGKLPDDAAAYRRDDAVVLDDVPATALRSAQIAALVAAVRLGGLGAVALGGPHSFSLGRYAKSSLQQILPVSSLVPGNLRRRNLAIELVLDRSGSMMDRAGGVPKIQMARSGARQTAAFIAKKNDELGIVDFDVAAHVLTPLRRLSPGASQRSVDAWIATLQADGGTDIYAGLKAGFEQLQNATTKQRHIILMTDGISAKANYEPLLAQLRAEHITVTTVALGADADRTLLRQIANGTGGHAYATDNARQLPKIFVKDTRLSAKPVRVKGHLRVLVASDSPILRSLAGRQPPGLSGNVVTTLKAGAQADLEATNHRRTTDPALAEWQVGAGRTVAWTAGLGAPWATAWETQPAVFDDAVRWAERGAVAGRLLPTPTAVARTLGLDLSQAGASAAEVTAVAGTLTGPNGTAHRVVFDRVGPALYRADVSALPEGVYRFAVTAEGDRSLASSGLVALPYPAEQSPVPALVSPLGQLVTQTGGVVISAGDTGALVGHRYALRELLTWIALALFFVGVAVRMWPGAGGGSRGGGGPRGGRPAIAPGLGPNGSSVDLPAPEQRPLPGEREDELERVGAGVRRHVTDAGRRARRLGLGPEPGVSLRVALAHLIGHQRPQQLAGLVVAQLGGAERSGDRLGRVQQLYERGRASRPRQA
jgi:Ca-activated chloride channel homolog